MCLSSNWASYLVWSLEVGASGTPHIQGYAEFETRHSLKQIKKLLPRAHLEQSRGTAAENLVYITKDGPPEFECGTPMTQGARTDLTSVRELALTGGMRSVVEQASGLQAIRVAAEYLKYHEPARTAKPLVFWLWGPTGAGKSAAAAKAAGDDAYWKDATKWWDGYDAHTTVVLDEFRGSWWQMTYMLRLLDRYPFRVECKGGSRQFVAETIIITSCHPPERVYSGCDEAIEQLIRRIDMIIELGKNCQEVGGNTETPTISDTDMDELIGSVLS